MKNREKKVVVLENLSSPFIQQAIIFLKDGAEFEEDKIIAEAERIVSGYFRKPPRKKADRLVRGGIILLASLTFAVIISRLF